MLKGLITSMLLGGVIRRSASSECEVYTPEECSALVMVNQDCRAELVTDIIVPFTPVGKVPVTRGLSYPLIMSGCYRLPDDVLV